MDREYQFPHVLTRWRKTGERDIYNQYSYTVEVIKCRYQDANRIYVDEYGQNQRSRAYIYTIGDDLQMGDLVIKGDFSNSQDPVENSFEIKIRRHHTNQRGDRNEYRYTV